ncbi:hypothetical protein Tco_1358717, partial [Tanacetum coccineum]
MCYDDAYLVTPRVFALAGCDKSDIVWESRKEDLSLQLPRKLAPVYHSCQRDPKVAPMNLLNQDLFYLKYGNSGPKKYTLSLHKYSAVPFLEDDIKERTSRWLSKCIRRSSIIWERVHDFQLGIESYQQKVNLTAPTITFPGIERKKLLTITSKPVVGLIYENNKKEKRVMILKENPKFCDATLKRVLEMVKKYNKDINPTDADIEYLEFYEEYIEDRLKHRDQMRRWE